MEDARLRDGDPVPPLLLGHPHETVLHEGLDHLVRHHVVRADLPLHLLLREARLAPGEDRIQLLLEPILVQVDVQPRDEAVQHEAAVDHEVLVRPGGHSAPAAMPTTLLNRLAGGEHPSRANPRPRVPI